MDIHIAPRISKAFSLVEPKQSEVPAKAGIHLQRGFSLVELSIVLVILGLLVGGVLAGQSLIRAAELRAVPTEAARFASAVQTFRDKYFALPGDMPNATAFWGVAGGDGLITTSACRAAATGTSSTCNGNGDGRVAAPDDMGTPPGTAGNERFTFWQHLSRAGLIEGIYQADGAGISYGHQRNVNTPPSRIDSALWAIHQIQNSSIFNTSQFSEGLSSTLNGKHAFIIGKTTQPVGTYFTSPLGFMLPEEQWNIDSKIDDGMPFTGKVTTTPRSGSVTLGWCSDNPHSTVTPTALYNLTGTHSGTRCCLPVLEAGF